MNISSESLLSLLGRPLDSPAVQQALTVLGMLPAPGVQPKRGLINVSSRERGLDISFKFAEKLRDEALLGVPRTCLITSVVFFHGPGFEGYNGYAQALPYGLRFGQSRVNVRTLLGAPSRSSIQYKNDRWDWERLFLTIDFTDDERDFQLVTVGLPWKPREQSAASP